MSTEKNSNCFSRANNICTAYFRGGGEGQLSDIILTAAIVKKRMDT